MSYWQDKVVLVTGGSAGLGFAIAKTFAERGAHVVITARDSTRLDRAKSRLLADGHRATAISADVTSQEQSESAVARTVETLGTLDVLVNNVGKSIRRSIDETTPEQFEELMRTNFYSVVYCTQAAMPHLVRSHGHVVNIGSLSAKTVSPFLGAYATSKFAVAAYSQQLRIEGPTEVHVLLVCPGPITREDSGGRYDSQAKDLPDQARRPGGGAKLKTIHPEALARQILRACERRDPELVVPSKARILFAASQLWPSIGDWILRKWT